MDIGRLETFKDDFLGHINVFGLDQKNGSVYILYHNNDNHLLLGNYEKFKDLPNDSYVWDMPTIPQVNDFHNWITEKYEITKKFQDIKDLLIEEINDSIDLDKLENIINKYQEVIKKEKLIIIDELIDVENAYDFDR